MKMMALIRQTRLRNRALLFTRTTGTPLAQVREQFTQFDPFRDRALFRELAFSIALQHLVWKGRECFTLPHL